MRNAVQTGRVLLAELISDPSHAFVNKVSRITAVLLRSNGKNDRICGKVPMDIVLRFS
jgi:hypothetical protein